MTILGIDPGYDRCGWAVVQAEGRSITPIAFDSCLTVRTQSKYQRFSQLFRELKKIVQEYEVEEIAVEELFFARNVNTALPVSEVRGLLFAIALEHSLPVSEYKPNQIKQTVTGYGRASKEQVLQMVMRQLRLEKIPKIDDTGDALAVALTHSVCRHSRLG